LAITYKDTALQIISYSNQATYNYYLGLLPNGVTEQTRRQASNMTSPLACIAHELYRILFQISLPWQRGSVGENCNWQHSMARSPKTPYRRKNFAKISYASQVIANFVPNFVAMATGVGRGKM